jgi:hypothetical protein
MGEDSILEEERQKLFAMVWARPATKVARELGISGVALGKRCRRLQVPKPPRGYWARVASGKTPRRPPLPAYRAEIEVCLRKQTKSTRQVRLSKLQLEFLRYALDELANSGVDTKNCELAYDGIRAVPPVLAAQLLILLQSRYEQWLGDRTTVSSINGALSSLSNLVGKLLPHAKEQLLVFHRKSDERYSRSNGPTVSLRATQDFLERVAHLSRLARDSGLAYLATDMSALEHAWSVNQISSPRAYSRAEVELCVSSHEVWIRADVDDTWSRDRFETVRMPLRDICPIDLMPPNEQRLPPKIRQSTLKPYADRLQALQEARAVFDALVDAAYDMERTVPNERLALFDRLWFSQGEAGPFVSARQAWRQLEADLEQWEQELESENVVLCQDVLGIEVGDIVVVEAGKSLVRVEVEGMSVYTSEDRVMFAIWGRRFRKDGLPGKRTEHFSIVLEND